MSLDNGSEQNKNINGNHRASMSHISNKSMFSSKNNVFGYKPIPKDQLEQSKQFVKNWLSQNVYI